MKIFTVLLICVIIICDHFSQSDAIYFVFPQNIKNPNITAFTTKPIVTTTQQLMTSSKIIRTIHVSRAPMTTRTTSKEAATIPIIKITRPAKVLYLNRYTTFDSTKSPTTTITTKDIPKITRTLYINAKTTFGKPTDPFTVSSSTTNSSTAMSDIAASTVYNTASTVLTSSSSVPTTATTSSSASIFSTSSTSSSTNIVSTTVTTPIPSSSSSTVSVPISSTSSSTDSTLRSSSSLDLTSSSSTSTTATVNFSSSTVSAPLSSTSSSTDSTLSSSSSLDLTSSSSTSTTATVNFSSSTVSVPPSNTSSSTDSTLSSSLSTVVVGSSPSSSDIDPVLSSSSSTAPTFNSSSFTTETETTSSTSTSSTSLPFTFSPQTTTNYQTTTTDPVTISPLLQQMISLALISAVPNIKQSQLQEIIKAFIDFISSTSFWTSEQIAMITPSVIQAGLLSFVNNTFLLNPEVQRSMVQSIMTIAPTTSLNQVDSFMNALEVLGKTTLKYANLDDITNFISKLVQLLDDNPSIFTSTTTVEDVITSNLNSLTNTLTFTQSTPSSSVSSSTISDTLTTTSAPVTNTIYSSVPASTSSSTYITSTNPTAGSLNASTFTSSITLSTSSPDPVSSTSSSVFKTIDASATPNLLVNISQFQAAVSSTLLLTAPNLNQSQIQDLTYAFANLMTILLPVMTDEQIAEIIPFLGYTAQVHILNHSIPFSPDVRDNMTQNILTMAANTALSQIKVIIDACDVINIFIHEYLMPNETPVMIPRMAQALVDYAKYVDGATITSNYFTSLQSSSTSTTTLIPLFSTTSTSTFSSTTTSNPFINSPQFQQLMSTTLLSSEPNLTQSQIQNLTNAFANMMSLASGMTTDEVAKLVPFLGQISKIAMLNNSVPFSPEVRDNMTHTILSFAPNTNLSQIDSIISATDVVNILVVTSFSLDKIIPLVPTMVANLVDYSFNYTSNSSNTTTFNTTVTTSTSSTISTKSMSTPTLSTSSSATSTSPYNWTTTFNPLAIDMQFHSIVTSVLQSASPSLNFSQIQEFKNAFADLVTLISNWTVGQASQFMPYYAQTGTDAVLTSSVPFSPAARDNITQTILAIVPNISLAQINAIISVGDKIITLSSKYLTKTELVVMAPMMAQSLIDFMINFISELTSTTFESTTSTTTLNPVASNPLFQQIVGATIFLAVPSLTQSQVQNLTNAFADLMYILKTSMTVEQNAQIISALGKIAETSILNYSVPYTAESKDDINRTILAFAPNATSSQISSIITASDSINYLLLNYLTPAETSKLISSVAQLYTTTTSSPETSMSTITRSETSSFPATSTSTSSALSTTSSTISSTSSATTRSTTSTKAATVSTSTPLSSSYPLTPVQVTQFINQMIIDGLNQSHAQQLVNPLERLMVAISTQPIAKISGFQPAFPWILPTLIAQVSGNPDKALNSLQHDSLNTTMMVYFPDMTQSQLAYSMTAEEDMAFILRDNYWISSPIAIHMANFFTSILIT